MARQFSKENVLRSIRILGIDRDEPFDENDVKAKWRKVIERVHPDVGGTNYFAEEANSAKDLLIDWIKAGRPTYEDRYNDKNTSGQKQAENTREESIFKNLNSAANLFKLVTSGIANILGILFGIIIWIIISKFAYNVYARASGPVCEFSNMRVEENIFYINGQADYGAMILVKIKNTGADGEVKVYFKLSTSEGDYRRETGGKINHDETKDLRADFAEPTVNARDIKGYVSCNKD